MTSRFPSLLKNYLGKIKDKYIEQEIPIPDIDELIDEKEKMFNDG
tara:strand:- start:248 stop:382 length:135 start_codon:yes stop_codon:yes gene_type:complete